MLILRAIIITDKYPSPSLSAIMFWPLMGAEEKKVIISKTAYKLVLW